MKKQDNECNNNNNNNEDINTDFTPLELKSAVRKLETNKTSGCDKIINEFLIDPLTAKEQ